MKDDLGKDEHIWFFPLDNHKILVLISTIPTDYCFYLQHAWEGYIILLNSLTDVYGSWFRYFLFFIFILDVVMIYVNVQLHRVLTERREWYIAFRESTAVKIHKSEEESEPLYEEVQ